MATLWMAGYYGDTVTTSKIHYFTSASAIGFGYQSSVWPSNILKSSTARYACVTTGLTSGETKSRGLNCISYDASHTKFAYSSGSSIGANKFTRESAIAAAGWNSGSPKPWQCFRVHFEHGSNVNADPATVWISSCSISSQTYNFCSCWIMEVSATGSQNWAAAPPASKFTMTPQNTVATVHSWYLGISIKPSSDAVGFNDDGYIQYSITYS